MKGRHNGGSKIGSTGFIMLLLSCLACVYVGGRLWQDSIVRNELLELARKRAEEEKGGVSVDNSVKIQEYKEKEKRLVVLEMELAEARVRGYSSVAVPSANGTAPSQRLLAVIGINTGFGQKARRDSIRDTWMPMGSQLAALEKNKGLVIRFTVGRSANKGDMSDRAIDDENAASNDFLILENHVEGYDELPKKTKIFFATAVARWNADFYMKVDDDVYVNIDKLGSVLAGHRDKPRMYFGCMKSGEVFIEPYFRHATGQIYGLSHALALYVSINSQMLHEYRNEDVSLGSWMLGLDTLHEDERRLCCSSQGECSSRKAAGDACIGVFDWRCSGLCHSVDRMKEVHKECAG
eukprot:jgi/Mesen1/9942/ME000705S09079